MAMNIQFIGHAQSDAKYVTLRGYTVALMVLYAIAYGTKKHAITVGKKSKMKMKMKIGWSVTVVVLLYAMIQMRLDTQTGVVKTYVFHVTTLTSSAMIAVHVSMRMMDTHANQMMMILHRIYMAIHTSHALYSLAIPSITLVLS
jgi:hypothetical protein